HSRLRARPQRQQPPATEAGGPQGRHEARWLLADAERRQEAGRGGHPRHQAAGRAEGTGEGMMRLDRPTRRGFLRIGGLGGLLSLADLLRGRAAEKNNADRSMIMVYLAGGPPHLDTFDLKPAAPREFRGLFDPIATSVPSIEICEELEELAKRMDRVALLRAVVAGRGDPGHSDSVVMSGWNDAQKRTGYPSVGAGGSKVGGRAP